MAGMDYRINAEVYNEKMSLLNRRLEGLPAEERLLAGGENAGSDSYVDPKSGWLLKLRKAFEDGRYRKPSDLFESDYKNTLEAMVPERYRKAFLYIVDRLNLFQYSVGYLRRSVRSESYLPWLEQLPAILSYYSELWLFPDRSFAQLLKGEIEAEKYSIYLRQTFYGRMALLLAAELDLGHQDVVDTVRDILTSENNTGIISVGLVKGILMSKNDELHGLLGQLLLAARLQEGVRQVICEQMDCGTAEAFCTLFQVIEKHGLIRYSSVRRAVCTWIGIYDQKNVDRLTDKMLDLMGMALRDETFRHEILGSEDAVMISCGLWATGFYNVQQAMEVIQDLIARGTKHQKLVASYYNSSLGNPEFEERAARTVLLGESDDLELIACFLPGFLPDMSLELRHFLKNDMTSYEDMMNKVFKPISCPAARYFKDVEEAKIYYDILEAVYQRILKKSMEFSPCIFPWHSVSMTKSEIAVKMCFIAYLTGDDAYIDKACDLIGDVSTSSNTLLRGQLVNLLLYQPKNGHQRSVLLNLTGNAETSTASKAYEIAKSLKLSADEYKVLESMMKSKRGEIRTRLEGLLVGQSDDALAGTIRRLMASSVEECRTGALDMIMELKKCPKREAVFTEACHIAQSLPKLSGKEQILMEEILGTSTDSQTIVSQKGFGLYDPDASAELKEVTTDKDAVRKYLNLKEESIIDILNTLDGLVEENRMAEYQAWDGSICLVGNEIKVTQGNPYGPGTLDQLPLTDVWTQFYEDYVKNQETMIQIGVYLECTRNTGLYAMAGDVVAKLYGNAPQQMPYKLNTFSARNWAQVNTILWYMDHTYTDRKKAFDMAVHLSEKLLDILTIDSCLIMMTAGDLSMNTRITAHPAIAKFYAGLGFWDNDEDFDEDFEKAFYLKWALEELFAKAAAKKPDWNAQLSQGARYGLNPELPVSYFFRAKIQNLISQEQLYHAIFEYYIFSQNISVITSARKYWQKIGNVNDPSLRELLEVCRRGVVQAESKPSENGIQRSDAPTFALLNQVYEQILPMILKVELRRGDSATIFSPYIAGINYICGTELFIQILTALGREPLDRDCSYSFAYYNSSGLVTKKSSMSRLLWASYPEEGANGETLGALLRGTDIEEKRLVEASMYAPQWIDLVAEHLGWKGFRSGCYYFMAHMNGNFDDLKKAAIARYTPLTTDELTGGAFDINWFWEAYNQLGETHFKTLYDAAKYISYGSFHTRARKFADAARGIVTADQVKEEVVQKRNKDLLLSYAIVPLDPQDKDRDLLNRYQYIQQFLKESRQFGAQRRANEAAAVSLALQNLSINAGYQDVTRLVLNVESRLTESCQSYFQWKTLGEIEYRIAVDDDGKSSVQVQKDGKRLTSIPSKDKKNEYVLMLTEVNKKLKDQFSRTRRMMEMSMEGRTVFTAGEIDLLNRNPVVAPIVSRLVFLRGNDTGQMGFFKDRLLERPDGSRTPLNEGDAMVLAHPVDLHHSGIWPEYQKHLFSHEIRQPFKQVFRELYVKLPEELPLFYSSMFAGNQIQPGKTVACLKGRRWIADYENGLQKIFYKENIVARIYALADWFSPADIEAPTLEWVEFSSRKDSHPLKIEDIPEIIYSEVMRDVDLAVSVAHVGGVDPEASHSTIEMRSAVILFNLPLFKLGNVKLEGNHAIIKGTKGEYTVHLGSGVVHKLGGTMISILPVHSQKRGRLFLPFVDNDPKTAEIMSKIVLFAEDGKIKDPNILRQM